MSNRFVYEDGEIQFGERQCDFCEYKGNDDEMVVCKKYNNGKPERILEGKEWCKLFQGE